MAKKLTALQTFEQGLPRANGGALKLLKDGAATAVEAENGDLVIGEPPKNGKRLPKAIVERLVAGDMLKVEDAAA